MAMAVATGALILPHKVACSSATVVAGERVAAVRARRVTDPMKSEEGREKMHPSAVPRATIIASEAKSTRQKQVLFTRAEHLGTRTPRSTRSR